MRSGVCAVIVILLLVSFSGCSEDEDEGLGTATFTLDYVVSISPTSNGFYSIIVPWIEIDYDNDTIVSPKPIPVILSGNGTTQYVQTEYGLGLEINSSETIALSSLINLTEQSKEFRGLPIGDLTLTYTDDFNRFRVHLSNDSLVNVTINNINFVSIASYVRGKSGWREYVSHTLENQDVALGWNILIGTSRHMVT